MMHLRYLLFVITLLSCAIVGAQNCQLPGTANPLGARIAQVAGYEYGEFNGHRINANGYLWKFGSVESESELLHDPVTGLKAGNRPGRFAWRRVWEYWLTLDRHVAGEAMSRKVIYVPDLLENPATGAQSREVRLMDLFAGFKSDDQNTDTALREAAIRAALNDSPWSAVFISYLMDRVNLSDEQFHYSSAHWQYIKSAFEEPTAYAFRACDPRKTTPRTGDLLCYSRGELPLKSFADWKRAVISPTFSVAAHCDVVIDVDIDAKKIETIGGNVMQSIARRKLKLNAVNVLSDNHDPAYLEKKKRSRSSDCQRDQTCSQDNLNLQYWSVLLQLK